MVNLDDSTKSSIQGEINHFLSLIKRTENIDPFGNAPLCDPDWNLPTIGGGPCVPFNDDRGVLHYYHTIIKGLNTALETGKIPDIYEPWFRRSPAYIRNLLENPGPFIA